MKAETYLFVGGDASGQQVQIEHNLMTDRYLIARRSYRDYTIDTLDCRRVLPPNQEYVLKKIRLNPECVIRVFVLVSLSDHEIPAALDLAFAIA